MKVYSITVGFSSIVDCWPSYATIIEEPDYIPWRVFVLLANVSI